MLRAGLPIRVLHRADLSIRYAICRAIPPFTIYGHLTRYGGYLRAYRFVRPVVYPVHTIVASRWCVVRWHGRSCRYYRTPRVLCVQMLRPYDVHDGIGGFRFGY